jgi:hypothetical protein
MWHAWGRGEVFTGFWLGGPKVIDHWEDLCVGGKITLRWTLRRQGSMGRTEDRVQWRAYMNTVMNLRVL